MSVEAWGRDSQNDTQELYVVVLDALRWINVTGRRVKLNGEWSKI
jgi:hypothetical protein